MLVASTTHGRLGHGEAGADLAFHQRLQPALLLRIGAVEISVPCCRLSGAEQLNASGPIGERPMISHSGAYSRLVSASG